MPRSVVVNIPIHVCVWGSFHSAGLTMACLALKRFFPGLLKADGNQEMNLIIIIGFLEEEGMAGLRCGTEVHFMFCNSTKNLGNKKHGAHKELNHNQDNSFMAQLCSQRKNRD